MTLLAAPPEFATAAAPARTDEVTVQLVRVADVRCQNPAGIDCRPAWINPAEWAEAENLTDRTRRWDWLAGRWASKVLLAGTIDDAELAAWCIRTRDRAGRPQAPRVFGRPAPAGLSVAHAAGWAAACHAAHAIGVDLVRHDADLARLPVRTPADWAVAEAAFKTGLLGASFSPGELRIEPDGDATIVRAADAPPLHARIAPFGPLLLAVCGPAPLPADAVRLLAPLEDPSHD